MTKARSDQRCTFISKSNGIRLYLRASTQQAMVLLAAGCAISEFWFIKVALQAILKADTILSNRVLSFQKKI